jgi:translation initiation factor 2 subunit 2
MNYQDLLKKAREELPETIKDTSRFEIPKVKGHLQGNTTVLSNFIQIAKTLGREPSHLLKYILKELASPGKLDGQRVILGSKISAKLINSKIRQYTLNYVLCSDCGKPDTKIIEEKGQTLLKCTACGNALPVRKI